MAEREELENPKMWDLENAEARPSVRGRRSVVSVAFPPADLAPVARAARERRMKLSEFIREAAVDAARPEGTRPISEAMFKHPTETRKEAVLVEEDDLQSHTEASSYVKDMELQIA